MRIIKTKDYNDMSRKAAGILAAQITLKENSVLGLATGSTVEGLYAQLVKWYDQGDIDFSDVRSVNLDEYVNLDPKNDNSYRYFMNHHFFGKVNIKTENTNVPNGLASDTKTECERYEKLMADLGGVDIQLLGLGLNGHIGFNEPAKEFVKYTNCVDLTESTIEANSRFFEKMDAVPKQALTMGIKSIMNAKKVLLCVNGAKKAKILKEVLFGAVTPEVPGSMLQMHQGLIVVADEEALSEIKL